LELRGVSAHFFLRQLLPCHPLAERPGGLFRTMRNCSVICYQASKDAYLAVTGRNKIAAKDGRVLHPDDRLRSRYVNKINMFKKPKMDEASATWIDVLLTLCFPIALVLSVWYQARANIIQEPFVLNVKRISTASADIPYPPRGLHSRVTCRAPGGCLAISYFNQAPPERASICFSRMKALRANICLDTGLCSPDCPHGNCCYNPVDNPSGGFLCDNWVFLPYNMTLKVDWCYTSRSNEGVFVFWSRHGGMGLDDSNVYESENRKEEVSLKCEYVSRAGSYMNTFLTTSCPLGGDDHDYEEEACAEICIVKDKKTSSAIYPEGVSLSNTVVASTPSIDALTPSMDEQSYADRAASEISFTCPEMKTHGYCISHLPIGTGTAIVNLENVSFVGWASTAPWKIG